MKKQLLGLVVALSATAAFAQNYLTPAQVCQNVARVNGSNGAICAQLISQNQYDQGTLIAANAAIPSGSSYAIQVMRSGANRTVGAPAGEVCASVAKANASNTAPCIEAVADTIPSMELLDIAQRLIPNGSSYAVQALRAGANAYLYAPLANVCAEMVSVNASNTVVCVQVIANKVAMNGSEQVCRASMASGSSYVIQCLRNIVQEYVPVPVPTAVMVELYQIQDLKRSIMKARAQMNRGMIDAAERTLDDASAVIEQILRANNQ